nr:tripartite tricarboxylate transporter permease [Nocardioides sp. B-3]
MAHALDPRRAGLADRHLGRDPARRRRHGRHWLAYGRAVATAKDKRQFGKGDPRGIVGPESANNSVEAGDLIPTFLFGIPGGVPSAMLLGMLLTYGIQPGPAIVTEHLDLMYVIIWCFAIASVAGAFLCFLATPTPAKLTKVPFAILGPGLLVVMLLGAYREGGQLGDLWVMVVLGVIGFFLKATGMPRAPFLIGFVLAIPMERYYYLTTSLYDSSAWMARPGVLAFAAIPVVPLLWSLVKRIRATRSGAPDDGHRNEAELDDADGDELEGSMTGTRWSLAVAVGAVLLFAGALVLSGSFSEEARLMPRPVAGCGLLAAVALLWQERRGWQGETPDTVDEVGPTAAPASGTTMLATRDEARLRTRREDLVVAGRTFASMAAFPVLVSPAGYPAAAPGLRAVVPALHGACQASDRGHLHPGPRHRAAVPAVPAPGRAPAGPVPVTRHRVLAPLRTSKGSL